MPSGERAVRIPENLRVVMRVQVDKTGCHNTARGVEDALGSLSFQAADLGDLPSLIAMSLTYRGVRVPSTTVPPLMMMS